MTIPGYLTLSSVILRRWTAEPAAFVTIGLHLAVAICVSQIPFSAHAQGAFPAPLPGQAPASAASPFPPVNGAPAVSGGFSNPPGGFSGGNDQAFSRGVAPLGGVAQQGPQSGAPPAVMQKCQTDFVQLRQDAEKKAAVISGLSKRKASAADACKAIGVFSQAETKMISYIENNSAKCGIPAQIAQQMKKSHGNTEQMQAKVCNVAQQQQQGPAGPSLSEALGGSALPEAKATTRSGGSTFDTLNGNVLTR